MVIAFLGLSDTGEGALIAVGGGIATLVVSQLFNRFQSNDERRSRLAERQAEIAARREEQHAERMEWYRRTLFERRLQAATEAYGWGMEIHRLREASREDGVLWLELFQTCKRGREWYHANAVYLNDDLPRSSNFIGVLNAAPDASGNSDFHKAFNEFLKELRDRTQAMLAPVRE
ncbi:MAG: hypothetical protein WEC75_01190 [Dehalococcoidia bacterium]